MKLSELINYRTQLESMTVLGLSKEVDLKVERITHLVNSHSLQLESFAQTLGNKKQSIQLAFEEFEQELDLLKQAVKHTIEAAEKPWFTESYRLYEQEMIYETTDYILARRPSISEDTEQFYRTRIVRYNSWKHATMIIRPGHETFINELLASDPMYLVDESHDLLAPCINMFNELYQNRLRPYTITERGPDEILGKLPNDQFGLVFAYNFFNYRPFEVIKKYFAEIYQKLRPGGVLAMTFNDCDRDKGVMLVEQHFCCYTPGYLIRELAQSLGYEIVFSWNDGGPSTWLELRKPGEFDSLRGGQSLAKILPKPIAESK